MASMEECSTSKASASASTPTPPINLEAKMENETPLNNLDECSLPRTSEVWNHYVRKRLRDGEIEAECIHCTHHFAGGPKTGTTHLHDHVRKCIKRRCVDIHPSILMGSCSTPSSDNKETWSLAPYQFKEEEGRKDLAKMIILHEYPLSMVEHYGFRKYSKTLQPGFTVPSRNTVKRDILKIYGEERECVLDLVKRNKSRIAITTNMWTSNNQRKGYMAITAHYVDDSWTLKSRILRFMYVPESHNKDALCETFLECVHDWNLNLQISTITADNCTTNDALVNLLSKKLPVGSHILGGKFLHMRCCAHILNLIVQEGITALGDGLQRVRSAVAFWRSSNVRIHTFETLAKSIKPGCTKKLVLDCKTQWKSNYEMLSVALMYKDVFDILQARDPDFRRDAPTIDDWKIAEKICDSLEMFDDYTKEYSATKTPTSNLYFSSICEIGLQIKNWMLSSDEVISGMGCAMWPKYEIYWEEANALLVVACVLDPRYKLYVVFLYLKKIYPDKEEYEDKCAKVKQMLKDLEHEYIIKYPKKKVVIVQPTNDDGNERRGDDKPRRKFLYDIEEELVQVVEAQPEITEFNTYLEEARLPIRADVDVLVWWKTNGSKFPTIEKLARDILGIPMISVASESAFSTSGQVLTPHQSRLLPSTVEALMCAQNWIWTNIKGELQKLTAPQVLDELEECEDEVTIID